MKRLALAMSLLVTAALLVVPPAGAITYGEPDGGEHPYVGLIIYFVPSESAWFTCSGTLLDADTFLTAAHCAIDIGTDGAESPSSSGGTDVWVTFEETDVFVGWPARVDYPTEQALYDARSAWLESNPDYVRGTAFPHPGFDGSNDFANFDVGVVELDEPSTATVFGQLAPLHTAEALAGATGRDRNNALVETVGYGVQAVQPRPMDVAARYKSTSRIVQINSSIAGAGNLHTLNNPSAIGGTGGSCFGDSGGPVFVNNTNQVIAVVSFGFSGTCHGADYSWRVDTVDSYLFLEQFLGT
jgi:hypothetical protein